MGSNTKAVAHESATAPATFELLRRFSRYFFDIIFIPWNTAIRWLFIVLS
jgi:hypothetical protein